MHAIAKGAPGSVIIQIAPWVRSVACMPHSLLVSILASTSSYSVH